MQKRFYRLSAMALCTTLTTAALAGCQQNAAMAPKPSAAVEHPTAPARSTAAPPATPAPAVPATPTQPAADGYGATQVIASYYQAIGQRQYAQAYQLWDDDGAASGQSQEQFSQGYASTAGVQLALGDATVQGQSASVPVTITSVENLSGGAQEVRQFSGAYTLRQEAGSWKIASASVKQSATTPQPPAERTEAAALLQAYYAAINARQYGRAYSYWAKNGSASQQGFAQFAQGFAGTASVELATGEPQQGAAAGSVYATIPAAVVARQQDGSTAAFCGSYQLRRTNVEPFQLLGWSIEKAQISPAKAAGSAKDVLASGCGG